MLTSYERIVVLNGRTGWGIFATRGEKRARSAFSRWIKVQLATKRTLKYRYDHPVFFRGALHPSREIITNYYEASHAHPRDSTSRAFTTRLPLHVVYTFRERASQASNGSRTRLQTQHFYAYFGHVIVLFYVFIVNLYVIGNNTSDRVTFNITTDDMLHARVLAVHIGKSQSPNIPYSCFRCASEARARARATGDPLRVGDSRVNPLAVLKGGRAAFYPRLAVHPSIHASSIFAGAGAAPRPTGTERHRERRRGGRRGECARALSRALARSLARAGRENHRVTTTPARKMSAGRYINSAFKAVVGARRSRWSSG